MKYCTNCGTAADNDAKYCTKCGSLLELTCPNCGAPLTPDSLFCSECGSVVSDTPQCSPHCESSVESSINYNPVKQHIPEDKQEEIPVHYRTKETNSNPHKISTFIVVLGIIGLFVISGILVFKFLVP